jgi:leucyl aminopeptidase (aminopeptidase T)
MSGLSDSLRNGAETIVHQCLTISADEHVVVVNDGNDEELLDALLDVVDEVAGSHDYQTYPAPEHHGMEPPERVADAMREADVFIAPTQKSLTHTDARVAACENGARGATLPTITKQVWNDSLQADYTRVREISEQVYDLLADTDTVHVTTPSGTDLTFDILIDYFHADTGIIHNPGEFGNLPAGEADGTPNNVNGTLVVDHFPFAPKDTRVEIQGSEAVAIEHPNGETSELAAAFDEIASARNVAEFGFGTNPAATLIGNVLQDEKVLGTVHVAFGDNTSYVPEGDARRVSCDIHWDTVCEDATVLFDDRQVLDEGDPVFLEQN